MSKKKKESKYIKMPSILMLPDNNYSALIPMPQDFIDDNGLQVLSTQKKQELNKKDMFYCCKCTQVISLHKDKSNGSFIALKCQHETCLKCAKAHTKHEMEILRTIPTCQVCPITITDEDLINIWGKFEATKLMDALFKEKSLKLPPFSPAMEVERALNGGENSNNNHDPNMNGFNGNHVQPNDDPPDRDINGNSRNADSNPAPVADPNSNHNPASPTNPIPSTQNDEPIEVVQNGNGHNDHINDNNDNDKDEDGYGYCFTDGCQKKGKLNPNNSKDEQSRLNCAYCGVMWCIRCGCEWHLGQTCKQYQEDESNFGMIYGQDQGNNNNDNIGNIGNVDHVFDKIMDGAFGDNEADDAFQELYQKNDWRTCPVCLSTIEKNDGCNRITCVCTTQFCWLCNQVLDPDTCMETHYGPESICSYR